ncbi:sugar phosphate isomerase/epimerase|uniref:sugar phosphate isomerase/epimerase family protein n=1 Tax=Pseudomonas sp. SbOxS1 TaxID=2723884 RepID=UPI0015D38963|nr:sugar phosphate isomerase/epimerase [Pseudomonas sp. SbOxS1]NYU04637.1 sugar phosphate isomerase/epimerase [Pseudomonas sp. SbOxS1]
MSGLGVAHLTALELAPNALVREAARAGFSSVGLRLHPAMAGGIAYPLLPGSQALRQLKTALDAEGVAVNEIEFVELTPQVDVAGLASLLESGAQLGARCLTVSGDDPEFSRLTDNFAALCQLAARYGLRVDLEFMRWRHIANLQQAVALIAAAGQANGGVLLDTLHLFRSGGDAAAVAELDRRYIHGVQWCDAPAQAPTGEGILREAREGRLAAGQGQLALAGLLEVLAPEVHWSVEVPCQAMGAPERLAQAFTMTRAWLDGHHNPLL